MKIIQETLDGIPIRKEENTKEDKIFIACAIILSAKIGDTFKDILRKLSKQIPTIRYKNEAGIRNVLEKMRKSGTIEMKGTFNGSQVTKISDKAFKEAREFQKNLQKLNESKIFF